MCYFFRFLLSVRSSRLGVFFEKTFLKKFTKFTRQLKWQSFVKNIQATDLWFIKKRLGKRCYQLNFLTFSRTLTLKNTSKLLISSTAVLCSLSYIPDLYLGFSVIPLNTTSYCLVLDLFTLSEKISVWKNFFRENFCHVAKISSLFPDEKFYLCFRSF